MATILLIHYNQLGKPSSLIGLADNYRSVDELIIAPMKATYPVYNPRLILKGAIYKIGIHTSDKVIEEVHYSVEPCIINKRRY